MRWKPRFGLLTLLMTPVYLAAAAKLWIGPHEYNDKPPSQQRQQLYLSCGSAPQIDVQYQYSAYRTISGVRVQHGRCVEVGIHEGRPHYSEMSFFRHGERHGPYTQVYRGSDAGANVSGQYEHDQPVGTWTTTSLGNQLTRVETYRAGKLHGDQVTLYPRNGAILILGDYRDGELQSEINWNDKGTVLRRQFRQLDGTYVLEQWDGDGAKLFEGIGLYAKGAAIGAEYSPHGTWTWFDESNRVEDRIEFVHGLPQVALRPDEIKFASKGLMTFALPNSHISGDETWLGVDWLLDQAGEAITFEFEDGAEAAIHEHDRGDDHGMYKGLPRGSAMVLTLIKHGLALRILAPGKVRIERR